MVGSQSPSVESLWCVQRLDAVVGLQPELHGTAPPVVSGLTSIAIDETDRESGKNFRRIVNSGDVYVFFRQRWTVV